MSEDQEFLSVTTAIGMLDKPGLLYWAAQEAARAAVDEQSKWRPILASEGREQAIKFLANARFGTGGHDLHATQLGTAVHEACESLVRDRQRPRRLHHEVVPFIDQFEEWLGVAQPTFLATEMTVFDPEHRYAGQADGIMKLGDETWLFDYKSTRKVYDGRGKRTAPYAEAALQMSAYQHAPYTIYDQEPRRETVSRVTGKVLDDASSYGDRVYLYGDREKEAQAPMPETHGCLAIHITPDHCNAHPIQTSGRIYDAFLALVTVAYVSRRELPIAVSKPLLLAPLSPTSSDEE